jgi:hypothetical protein
MKAGDSHYQDRVVRLHELLTEGHPPIIKGFTFDGCHIVGPAVVMLSGEGSITSCTFDGTPDALFLQLTPEQDQVIGVVVFENCTFDRCRFAGVGFLDRNGELRGQMAA